MATKTQKRKNILIGYRSFVSSKNGQMYNIISVLSELSDKDIKNGYVGRKIVEIFISEDFMDIMVPENIDKEIIVQRDIDGEVESLEVL